MDTVTETFGLSELVCIFWCLAWTGFVSYRCGFLCEVVAVVALPVLILVMFLCPTLKWEGGVVSF